MIRPSIFLLDFALEGRQYKLVWGTLNGLKKDVHSLCALACLQMSLVQEDNFKTFK